ncbi:MAG: GWxTD domain-containing protein, partial [Thermoanaerobaculia bacterium]
QRIAALPEDDRVWLTEFVAPIILPEEEKAFLQLTETSQREGFQSDFWQRREKPDLPLPMGPGYRDRYSELRKLVDEKYDGWQSGAGGLVLRRGEPDSIFKPRCGGEEVFRDLEVWTYGSLELNGRPAARHIFYRPAPGAPRRLWIVHDGNASVFQVNPCRVSFDRLSRDCGSSREDRCSPCEDRCAVYQAWAEILKRQGSPGGALAEQAELLGYPKISTEGLNRKKAGWAAPMEPSAKAREVAASSGPAPAVPTPAPTRPAPPQPTPAATPAVPPHPTRAPATATAPPATPPSAPVRAPTAARPTPAPTPARTTVPTPRPTAVQAPTRAPTPEVERLRKLSPEEIRDRTATLEPEYKEFLDLARPLLTEEEVSRFLQLSGHDKDAFIREFWKRHS